MAKVDGLHQQPRAPALRGALTIQPTRAGLVAKAWPKKRGKRLSPKQQAAIEAFTEAALICKYAPSQDQLTSRKLARGSQFLPRDLQYMAIYGRLCTLFFTNGERRYQMASKVDISELLDVLGFAPGTVLYRGADYWEALPPPTADSVLATINGQLQWSSDAIGASSGNIPFGAVTAVTGSSASNRATKGLTFTPRRAFAIARFLAFSRGISSVQNLQRVTLAKSEGQGNGLVLGEIVAQTPLRSVPLVSTSANYFDLGEEVQVEPGQQYTALLSGDYTSGTSALTVLYYNGTEGAAFLAVPADLDPQGYQFAVTNPAPSDTPDALGAGPYLVLPIVPD